MNNKDNIEIYPGAIIENTDGSLTYAGYYIETDSNTDTNIADIILENSSVVPKQEYDEQIQILLDDKKQLQWEINQLKEVLREANYALHKIPCNCLRDIHEECMQRIEKVLDESEES